MPGMFSPTPPSASFSEFDQYMQPLFEEQRQAQLANAAAAQQAAAAGLQRATDMQNPVPDMAVPQGPNPLMTGLAGFFAHLNQAQSGSGVLPAALSNAMSQQAAYQQQAKTSNQESKKQFALSKLQDVEKAHDLMLEVTKQSAIQQNDLATAQKTQEAQYKVAATAHAREVKAEADAKEKAAVADSQRSLHNAFAIADHNAKLKLNADGSEDTSWLASRTKTTASGKQFIDMGGLSGKMKDTAIRQAATLGLPTVTEKDVAALRDISSAILNVNKAFDLVSTLLPKDAQARVAQTPNIRLSELFQTNAQRGAFKAWRTSAIRTLRAEAGSGGLRLNQKEIELAVKNELPELNDTVAVAAQKKAYIMAMLLNAETPIVERNWGSGDSGGGSTPAAPPASGVVEWVRKDGKLVRK